MRAAAVFTVIARKAPELEYMLWCDSPICMCNTPHDIHVIGDWEYYTCRHCRKQESYRVR